MIRRYQTIQEDLKKDPKHWLITGVAGFIGSNLLEALLQLNQTVTGLDNFATGFQANLQDVQKNVSSDQWKRFDFIKGDIADPSICKKACKNINFVLHQAALGSVPRSIADPLSSNNANISGHLNMLVAAKDSSVEQFVYAASSSTYGDHPALPKLEDSIGKPLSPYAVTKLVNELYSRVFFDTYAFDSIGLRYFNVFGRRQAVNSAYAAVIPEWLGSIMAGEDIFINGDGATSRDFTYIDNVIQANILAAHIKNRPPEQIYNIAAGSRTSLIELHSIIAENIAKQNPALKIHAPKFRDFRPGDVRHSLADITKAKKFLGYDPHYTAQQGLEHTVEWYLSNLHA